ncbi:MAG: hypothetical protein AAGL17_17285 [Cyanobacteria bacterium J06576_12]
MGTTVPVSVKESSIAASSAVWRETLWIALLLAATASGSGIGAIGHSVCEWLSIQ